MPGIVNTPSRLTSCKMALVFMLALSAFAPILHAGQARAQKHENRHEIERIEEAWRNAVLKGDVPAMDALLADDYMAITASGTLETKEKALANLRGAGLHITSIGLSERKMRFYGTTVLVTSRAEINGATGTRDISGSYRYTHVYARDAQGKWKIVSFEANRIRDPDEHK
jgi:ketosteroid isomerase-like protein